MILRNTSARPTHTNKARALLSLLALVLHVTGCLGDDRCSPNQRLEGTRCVALPQADGAAEDDGAAMADATPDGGEDRGPGDQAVDDASTADADGALGCAFAPEASDLVGTFQQLGKVDQSSCVIPLPRPDDAFDAEVTFTSEGGKLEASIKTPVATVDGDATIAADGKVHVTAAGKLLEITLTVTVVYCFSDADNATTAVTVTLADASGPMCDFTAPGTLSR